MAFQSTTHKHLGMILDTKMDFQEHLKDKLSKISKTIRLLGKLHKILTTFLLFLQYGSLLSDPILTMATLYMTKHIIPHFIKTSEIQTNSELAITGITRGTSKEKLYQKLRLESLSKKRWYQKLCCFYKIFNKQSPTYLLNITSLSN